MKFPSALFLSTCVLFCLAALEARAGRFVLFERNWGDCVVVTDMTEAGRALRPASPKNPVYYLGESIGCSLGSVVGDRVPNPKEMGQFVARVLAKHGYLAAQPGIHEPELFLVLQWGRLDPRSGDGLWFLGYDPTKDPAAEVFSAALLPGGSVMLGPEVHRRSFRPREIQTVLDYVQEDIYGFIISAFEYESAHTADPVVLWQTRIGLPARGKGMTAAVEAMTKVAGPQIGRETVKPVLHNMDDRFTTKLGELEVIGFDDNEPAGNADEGAR